MSLPQLNLNFGTVHHLSDLHSRHKAGIAFSEMSEQWREYAARQYNQAVEFCIEHSGSNDSYMAVNGIKPFAKRCFESVSYLTANFIDLDFYVEGLSFDDVLSGLMSRCHELNIELPSKVIDSGRGAYAVWEFAKPVYCGAKADNATKRKFAWQDTQAMLIALFADLGADPKCKDVARVLRLVGTNNSKVNRTVQAYTVGDRLKSPVSFSKRLKELTKPEPKPRPLKQTTTEPTKPFATFSKGNVSTILNARSLNFARTADLRKLAELRGGKLTDNRAMTIFYYAMSASYLNVDVEGVCRSVSDFMTSCIDCGSKYDADNPQKLLGALLKRHGKKGSSNYEERPYIARNQTIINALSITEDEQRHLSTIIGKEEKYRRNNERRMDKARDNGAVARKEYEENSLSKSKPWEAMGMSRAKWYRMGKPTQCELDF